MWYRTLVLLAFIGASSGCDEAVLQPGEEGAECRIGADPCADGLSCTGGQCQVAPANEPERSLDVTFTIADRYMRADGLDSTPILIEANQRVDGEAYSGELLIFPSPIEAGRMDPSVVQFVDGLAQTVYVTCRAGGALECPEFVTLYAAFTDNPLEPFAFSKPIKLVDPTAAFMSVVPDEGCEQNVGQVAYRNDLSRASEASETFGPGQVTYSTEGEQLTLQLSNANVSFRFAADSDGSSQQRLTSQDLAVSTRESLDMPDECNMALTSEWAGELIIRTFEQVDDTVQSIDVSFDISCRASGGQIASIRGCFKFDGVSEM
ncbi:MAG: hypothetical protein VYA30_12700 [Myxococcota bacterium]|nr:hypothetical protein [Myxococcota bacterium]